MNAPTLNQKVLELLAIAGDLATEATSPDLAASLTILGDLEKVLRKKRVAWMATLVRQAGQRPLA